MLLKNHGESEADQELRRPGETLPSTQSLCRYRNGTRLDALSVGNPVGANPHRRVVRGLEKALWGALSSGWRRVLFYLRPVDV